MAKPNVLTLLLVIAAFTLGGCATLLNQFGIQIRDNRIQFDDHIHFASDSDVILEDSYALLDALGDTLRSHDEIHTVRIVGHTDAQGGDEHNQDLSERRAASVAAYLASHGVTQRLAPEGVGEADPLCTDETEACHARNRRVEFIIVD